MFFLLVYIFALTFFHLTYNTLTIIIPMLFRLPTHDTLGIINPLLLRLLYLKSLLFICCPILLLHYISCNHVTYSFFILIPSNMLWILSWSYKPLWSLLAFSLHMPYCSAYLIELLHLLVGNQHKKTSVNYLIFHFQRHQNVIGKPL